MINYRELKKLGLTDKEAKIYLTSLQRGPETAPSLAKIAEVVRPTAYVVYENLIKKGLMSTFTKGKKTFYVAEPPEHLLSLLRLQKQEIEETERQFSKIIPELNDIANTKGDKPNVRVFEGLEGLQSIREVLLKTKAKEINSFIPVDELFSVFSEKEHKEVITKRRIKRKIKSQIFYTRDKGPFSEAENKEANRDAIWVDKKQFPFNAGIDIYENYLAIYTFKGKLMGILIEDHKVASTMKSIFQMLWKDNKK